MTLLQCLDSSTKMNTLSCYSPNEGFKETRIAEGYLSLRCAVPLYSALRRVQTSPAGGTLNCSVHVCVCV